MNDLLAQVYSYLHGMWTYRWSALIIAWVVAIVGWTVVYFLPNQYTSIAVMHIDTASAVRSLTKGLAADTSVDKELGILKRRLFSEKNLQEIVMNTDLRSKAYDDDAMSRLTKELAASIYFTGESLSRKDKKKKKEVKTIYTLAFEGRSPELVYQIVDRTLNSLVESTLASARTDHSTAQKFLNEQITEYESRLSTAEQNLAEFTRENIGLMPDDSGDYYGKLQREQDKLDSMRSELNSERKRLTEMRRQLKGEIPIHSGQQLAKIKAYRAELQDLLTQYTESHPDVQSLRTIISETLAEESKGPLVVGLDDSTELNPAVQELKTEVRNTSIQIEAFKAQVNEQDAKVKLLKSSVNLIPEIEAKLAKLNRDYGLTKQRYLKLVEKREAAKLAEAVGQSGNNIDIQILAKPFVAEEPSGPNRLMLMSIVFAAALAAGLAWGVLKFTLQPTFIYLRQLEDQLGLPIFGTVGLYMTEEHKKKRRMQLTSFLLVLFLLVIAYGTNMYIELGITIDDILMSFRSSDI